MANFGDQDFSDISDFEQDRNDTYGPTVYVDWTTQYSKTIDSIEPQEEELKANAEDPISPVKSLRQKRKKSKLPSEVHALLMFFIGQRHPKKEYVRCKLIRGHKRALRQVYAKKYPTATIHKIDIQIEVELKSWNAFRVHANKFNGFFTEACKTENGPKTDGIAKRIQQKKMTVETQKSFNDAFCRKYFSDRIMLESYKLYIDIIFATFDAENLCNRFEFKCCSKDNLSHYPDCLRKWKNLEIFIKDDMVHDLEVEPTNQLDVIGETEEIDLFYA